MCLVDQDNDVAPLIQDAVSLAELVDGGDDDLAGIAPQEISELGSALGRDHVRHISPVEGGGDLRVQVSAVHDNDDRRVSKFWVQAELLRGEDHQKALTRTLEVPDQTLPDLSGHHPLHNLVSRLILLIAGDELDLSTLAVGGEGGEAPGKVEHDLGTQHRGHRQLDLAQPRHHIIVGSPRGPHPEGHPDRPVPVLLALRGEGEHVRNEEPGHIDLIVIVNLGSSVHPAHRRSHGRLGLTQNQREPVDESNDVEALCRACSKGDLIRHHKRVLTQVVEVDQPDINVLIVGTKRHCALAADPGHELLVGPDQAIAGDAEDDPTETVDDFISSDGISSNLRIEADECFSNGGLDHHVRGCTDQGRPRLKIPTDLPHSIDQEFLYS